VYSLWLKMKLKKNQAGWDREDNFLWLAVGVGAGQVVSCSVLAMMILVLFVSRQGQQATPCQNGSCRG
jgi:hypothetical protein